MSSHGDAQAPESASAARRRAAVATGGAGAADAAAGSPGWASMGGAPAGPSAARAEDAARTAHSSAVSQLRRRRRAIAILVLVSSALTLPAVVVPANSRPGPAGELVRVWDMPWAMAMGLALAVVIWRAAVEAAWPGRLRAGVTAAALVVATLVFGAVAALSVVMLAHVSEHTSLTFILFVIGVLGLLFCTGATLAAAGASRRLAAGATTRKACS